MSFFGGEHFSDFVDVCTIYNLILVMIKIMVFKLD